MELLKVKALLENVTDQKIYRAHSWVLRIEPELRGTTLHLQM